MTTILVTSYLTNDVLMYDQEGLYQGVFGEANQADSGLTQPRNLIIDKRGNVYVSSFATNQILKYDKDGNFLGEFAQANGPVGLAFDSKEDLYIGSFWDSKVLKYSSEGILLDEDFIPSGDNGLLNVTGLNFDRSGTLYVNYFGDFERVDKGGVLKYDSSGNFIELFTDNNEIHPDDSRLNGPYELAFNKEGNIFVSSLTSPYYVLEYDASGNPLGIFGEVNDIDTPDLSDPHGLAFDRTGNLLVTASTNSNLLEFTPEGDSLGVFGEASNALSPLDAPTDLVFTTFTNPTPADVLKNAYIIQEANFDSWSQGYDVDGYLKVLAHPDEKILFDDPLSQWREDNQDYKNGNFVYESDDGSYYSSWGPKEVLEVTLTIDELEEILIDGFGTIQAGELISSNLEDLTAYQFLRAYNGRIPGPMLITEPGDTIRITLENDLDDQVTNLHTHGLHVSPVGNGDNVLISTEPGDSWVVEIEIPENHFIGPDWYHPHLHGTVNWQISSGLGGYLLINPPHDLPDLDKFDPVEQPSFFMALNTFGIQQIDRTSSPNDPLNQSDPEILIPAGTPLEELEEGVFTISDAPYVGYNAKPLFYDPQSPLGGFTQFGPLFRYGDGTHGEAAENVIHTVNGQYNPTIEVSTGEWTLFSFANMSVNSFHIIQLVHEDTEGNLSLEEVLLVAIDGDAAGVVEDVRRNVTETPILNPGSRLSLQHIFDEPGKYYFLANATEELLGDDAPILTREKGFNDGHLIWGSQVLATVEVTGDEIPTEELPPFPEPFDVLLEQSNKINELVDSALAGDFDKERTFVWDANFGGATQQPAGDPSTFEGIYTINGEFFASSGGGMPALTMPMLGTTEIWNLVNNSGVSNPEYAEQGRDFPLTEWHPFHIHQNDFVVLEINGISVEDMKQNYLARVLSDTIALPPSHAPGSATPENPFGTAQFNGDPSVVKILMEFADFPGSYVNHCHILFHEDAGMMAMIRVILNTEDTWLGLGGDVGETIDLFQASDTSQKLQVSPYGDNFNGGVDVAIADVNFQTQDEENVNVNDNVTDVVTVQRKLDNQDDRFEIKIFDGETLFRQQQSEPTQGSWLVTSFRSNDVLVYDQHGIYQGVFGEANQTDTGLTQPRNLVIDKKGNVYVSSFATNQILKYDQHGNFKGEFAQANGPVGLAFDSNGNLYIGSFWDSKVLKYSSEGVLLDENFIASGDNGLLNVTGLNFDADDNLYVNYFGDFQRINKGAVLKYDGSGNFIEVFTDNNEIHPDNSRLDGPYELAFDYDGNAYISSLTPPYSVEKYDLDGNPLGIFGEVNDFDTPDLSDPHGLIFDKSGDLYVTASTNSSILKFTSEGESLGVFGEASSALSRLNAPTDIDFNSFITTPNPNFALLRTIKPFANFVQTTEQEASVASGDINGDGFADIITALGGGIAPIIELYSGKDYSLMGTLSPFHHYGFTGTVNIASGDINGDNFDDILVAQGEGGTGLVEAFDGLTLNNLILSGEIINLSGIGVAHETAMFSEAFQPYGDSYTGEIEITSGYVLQTPDFPNGQISQTNAANITTLAVGDVPEGHEKIKIHTYISGGHEHGTDDNEQMDMANTEVRLDKEFTPESNITEISGTFADVNGDRGQGVLYAKDDQGGTQLIHLQEENVPEYITVSEPTPPEPEVPKIVFGTPGGDEFDSAFPDDKQFVGDEQILFTGGGDDYVDVSEVGRRNRIDTGSGDDIVFAGNRNRIILGSGDDIIFAGAGRGANRISLGAGNDQLWLTTDDNDIPNNPNRVSDFNPDEDVIGFANTSLGLDNKGDLWDYQQVENNVIISAFGQEIAQLFNTTIQDNNFVFA